ncbi:MAG: transcription antitermination factor NusB [Desulfuromonadales bacterium]|nr:transcription antitermination factor NusB [Desulfuromonadales bacterium]
MSGNRRTGRELALKILYSLQDQPSLERLLHDFWENFRFQEDLLGEPMEEFGEQVPWEVRRFAEELARGVAEHREELDRIIGELSTNWALERMARVDLALLRLGAFELLHRPQTPASVIINEAVEIGKRFGTKETPSFVNGILDRIARNHRPPTA